MEKALCCTCFKPKATLTCGICTEDLCKYCAQFLEEDSFSFLNVKPTDLQHDTFCGPCFDAKVAPELAAYNDTVERAKEILIFTKVQNKETRFIRRDEERIHVAECDDRNDVIMRLAFQAVQKGFNGLIDIDLETHKVRSGAYQTTTWKGSGIPAQINPDKLMKDRSIASQPN
jgi:hypothetical protein